MLYSDILLRLGLNENEAKIYELLLLKGETKARDLLEDSGLSRGNVYNVLTSLTARGLIQVTEGKQQHYKVVDPTQLSALVDDKKRSIDRLNAEFQAELPKLLSTYSLTTGKPTVRVFEGVEGFVDAIEDTIIKDQEILAYIDAHAITGAIADADTRYVHRRIKRKIFKRILIADTSASHEYIGADPVPYTSTAFVQDFPDEFGISVQVYGDSVLFLSIASERIISVIVDDPRIAEFHRKLFEFHWRQAVKTILAPDPESM